MNRVDVNVIGMITEKIPTHDSNQISCGHIATIQLSYGFKGVSEKDRLITINIFDNMEIGQQFLLYLAANDSNKNLKTSTNSRFLEHESAEAFRCQDALKPDYNIVMEGLGALDITKTEEGNHVIRFHTTWVTPPATLPGKLTGHGWEAEKQIDMEDFIAYMREKHGLQLY